MSDNLKLVEQDVETFIDPNGAPQSILAQNHQNILKQVLSKTGKYTGFPFIAENTVSVFTPGTFSWEGNSMDNTTNFDIKISRLTSDLNDIGIVLGTLSQGDFIHFKDYLGKSAMLEYDSHTNGSDGSGNDIYIVTLKATNTNLNYTYQATEKNIALIEFFKNGGGVTANYEIDIQANQLILLNNGTQVDSVDLSLYLDDTNLARIVSGVIDGNTKIVTFTRDDNTTFTVDFSPLFSSLDLELTVLKGVADDLSDIDTFTSASGASYPNGYFFIESSGGNQFFAVKNNQTDHGPIFANTQFGFGSGGTGWAKFSFLNDNGVEVSDVFPSVPSFAEINGYSTYDISNYNIDFTTLTQDTQYPFKFTRLREASQWASSYIRRDNITQASSALTPSFTMPMNVSGFTQISDDVGRDFTMVMDPPDAQTSFLITNFAAFNITSATPRTITIEKSSSAPTQDKLINPQTGAEEDQLVFSGLEGSGMFIVKMVSGISGSPYTRKYFVTKIGFAQTSGSSTTVDSAFSSTSLNPLENRVIRNELFILEGVSSQRPVNHAYRLGMAFNANYKILSNTIDQVSANDITFDREIIIANIGGTDYVLMSKGSFDGLTYLQTGVLNNTGNVIKMSLFSYGNTILLNYRDYAINSEVIFENTPVSVAGTLPTGYEAFEVIQGTNLSSNLDVSNRIDTRNTIFVLKTAFQPEPPQDISIDVSDLSITQGSTLKIGYGHIQFGDYFSGTFSTSTQVSGGSLYSNLNTNNENKFSVIDKIIFDVDVQQVFPNDVDINFQKAFSPGAGQNLATITIDLQTVQRRVYTIDVPNQVFDPNSPQKRFFAFPLSNVSGGLVRIKTRLIYTVLDL